MNYRVLFFIIGISIMLMGSTLFFIAGSGAKQAQQATLAQTGSESASVVKGLFAVRGVSYAQAPPACSAPFTDDAYATLTMHYLNPPRSCEVFVNERLVSTQRSLRPSCIGECPNEEFDRTIHLGMLDVRDRHSVRVCCNDICVSEELSAVCPLSNS